MRKTDYSKFSEAFQDLFRQVQATTYREQANLYYEPLFRTKFKHLDKTEQGQLVMEMFNYTWNTPKMIDGAPAIRRYPDVISRLATFSFSHVCYRFSIILK